MRRPPALPMLLATTALAVVGCALPGAPAGPRARLVVKPAAPVAGQATTGQAALTVRPAIRPAVPPASIGARTLLAGSGGVSNAYDVDDVHHIVFKLYVWDGGLATETEVAALDVRPEYFEYGLTFSRLKGNTTYRVRGFAYKAAGTAAQDLISVVDGDDYAEHILTDGDSPPTQNVPVQLIGRAPLLVVTLAGDANDINNVDGPGLAARFSFPRGVAVDATGRVYVADYNHGRIRKISQAGAVATLAGSSTFGADNGASGATSTFNLPIGLATDDTYVYVAEYGNHMIRRVAIADGATTTVAGDGTDGFNDGAAAGAQFSTPHGVAVAADGTLYVADTGNHRIRKITTGGTVSTIAGDGTPGMADGPGATATLNGPRGIAIGPDGSLYVADSGNHAIRKLVPDGAGWRVSRVAGDGVAGSGDGYGGGARFSSPEALAVAPNGFVYVGDGANHTIRRIAPNGGVRTIAGGSGSADGVGADARFNYPNGLAIGPDGVLYVGDMLNGRIRRIL